MLDIVAGAATDVGSVRERNEDSLLSTSVLFAVADGMGGHAAGDVASQLAVAELAQLAKQTPLTADRIVDAVGQVNLEIRTSALARRDRFGMGTTLTGLAVVEVDGAEHWLVFNVGDSRVYRFADDLLTQLTVDHSEIAELLAAEAITAEEAATHPRRHIITRSLGIEPAPVADVWTRAPSPGERFLLCSDGLTLEVGDLEVANILRVTPDAQAAAEKLVAAAVQAGGRDNVTAVVVDLRAGEIE